MPVDMTLVRRRRRDMAEIPLGIEISHARRFTFALPDGIPYDNEDSDAIVDELGKMHFPPREIMGPVPDGYGGLVSDGFDVVFWDDKREDYEIMLDIEDAVKRGLGNRAWLIPTNTVDPIHLAHT